MAKDDIYKTCPEYCPFLKANQTYCELFRKSLQTKVLPLKCEECKNPVQRMESYKALDLPLEARADMWQKALAKHHEIELGKKREEEAVRKKFAAFLEDKYGSRPPLDGNSNLKTLVINLFMVMDATERQMMTAVLNSNNGDVLLQAIERAPKDNSLLRNIRRELDSVFRDYQQSIQNTTGPRTNIRS